MSILKTEYNEDEFAEVTYKDGLEDGIKQGKAEGILEANIAIIKRFSEMGLSLEQIAQGTNLTLEKVKEILEKSETTNKD